MTYRILVNDGGGFVTYIGNVLEWTDDRAVIELDTHGTETQVVTVSMACVVGAEELVA